MTNQNAEHGADLVTWTMSRKAARDLLGWLRHNRPIGMPDSTFYGLVGAISGSQARTRNGCGDDHAASRSVPEELVAALADQSTPPGKPSSGGLS